MTATYTAGATDKDTVRFLIGDRNVTAGVVMFSDEEINVVLAIQPNVTLAAIECLDAALAEYAHLPSTSNGSLSVGAERVAQMIATKAALTSRINGRAGISVGGRTMEREQTQAANADLRQPAFTVDMNDNKRVAPFTDQEF